MNLSRERTVETERPGPALRFAILVLLLFFFSTSLRAEDGGDPAHTPKFQQYCYGCHSNSSAMAGINLQQLVGQASPGEHFQQWEKVIAALEQKRMPPPKLPAPSDAERAQAVTWIRAKLTDFATKHAGDPGPVTLRRLTGGEYAYTVQDLTGLDLKLDRDFVSDSVGGEGFTNFGDVQFMDNANLERYLETAKRIANHAVIGAGPLSFYEDAGKSGFELSAINRIQEIYRKHGFRAVAGEGGKAYGLESYSKAFFVAWQFRHRKELGQPSATLRSLAAAEGLSLRFASHIWTVLQQPTPLYPTSEAVTRWRKLPAPAGVKTQAKLAEVRAECNNLRQFVVDWPRWLFAAGELAAGGQGDERALVLTDESLQSSISHNFKFNLRNGAQGTSKVYLTVVSANPGAKDSPLVLWRNATVRFRGADKGFGPPASLRSVLNEGTAAKLAFGRRSDGEEIGPDDFATAGGSTVSFEIPAAEKAVGVELQVTAEVDAQGSADAVLRCTISDREEPAKGRPVWALLAHPKSPGFQAWKAGVLAFARDLPQISHGEPTPSDKDPIPPPFNTAYNQPERDHFHVKLKYFRDDRFLREKMLDDGTRLRLDQAWADLLSSFEYHDAFLHFVAGKYGLPQKKGIAAWTPAQIQALAAEPRKYVQALSTSYRSVVQAQQTSQPGHVEDSVRLAALAWRRPLTEAEKTGLRSFYSQARNGASLDHAKAIRALLTRVFVATPFLYRLEQPALVSGGRPLSNWEMASRLSYFLWSSLPDEELRRAAAKGELSTPQQVEVQVKRMLADAKSRRMATDFFGQWLGFYRFDQYRGVDATRFPEFTDEVKSGMYDEAVSFFEHVIRKDRPVGDLLFADYTFLNKPLAKHYGVEGKVTSPSETEMVSESSAFQRGGLLRLGAVLTSTSAPLRTSPVKRGDWVLRRVLGTPTPPPPADAGSIPADEKSFGGLTVRERLAAHQRNATCAGCHSRIDPLGFPLEKYDAVGRWRAAYSDGKAVDDTIEMADKTRIAGVDGLLLYLRSQDKQVLTTVSQKLLGYALGRTILASDQPLIDRLTKKGWESKFSDLVGQIATSRQFRYRREREHSVPSTGPASGLQESAQAPPRQRLSMNRQGGL